MEGRANLGRALAEMTTERHREMAMTREAEVERESAQVLLAAREPRQRLRHPDAQQVLVRRDAGFGREHSREMTPRDSQLRRDFLDAMRRTRRRIERGS